MNNFTHATLMTRDKLDEQHYFESLLLIALELGMIDVAFAADIRQQLNTLLVRQCQAYAGGRSTSLPKLTVEGLSESILFTLHIYMKQFEPADALALLVNRSVERNYIDARTRLDSLIRSTELYYRMETSRPLFENTLLTSTFLDGISAFFKQYNPEYGAHEIHITADYPVLFYPTGFRGIEFIQKYTENFALENRFLRWLPQEKTRKWISHYAARNQTTPRELCDNLFLITLAGWMSEDAFAPDSLPSEALRAYVLRTRCEYALDLYRVSRFLQ